MPTTNHYQGKNCTCNSCPSSPLPTMSPLDQVILEDKALSVSKSTPQAEEVVKTDTKCVGSPVKGPHQNATEDSKVDSPVQEELQKSPSKVQAKVDTNLKRKSDSKVREPKVKTNLVSDKVNVNKTEVKNVKKDNKAASKPKSTEVSNKPVAKVSLSKPNQNDSNEDKPVREVTNENIGTNAVNVEDDGNVKEKPCGGKFI